MSSFFSQKTITAIDIHDTDVRLVQMSVSGEILNNRSIPLPAGVFKKDRIIDQQALAQTISKLIDGITISHNTISLAIPDLHCFLHTISLPPGIEESKKRSTILEMIKTIIPIEYDQTYWDYVILPATQTVPEKVFYASTPREIIDSYRAVFQLVGLTIATIDVEGLVLGRALLNSKSSSEKEENTQEVTMIVTISDEVATIDTFDHQKTLLTSSIVPFSGGSFTKTIVQSIPRVPIPQPIPTIVLDTVNAETNNATVLQTALQIVIDEIKQASHFIENSFQKKVGTILLAGELALMPNIETYFSSLLGISVKIGNPLINVSHAEKMDQTTPVILYANTIGILLREVLTEDKSLVINFMQSVDHISSGKKEVTNNQQNSISEKKEATSQEKVTTSRVKNIFSIIFVVATLAFLGFILYRYLIIPMMG